MFKESFYLFVVFLGYLFFNGCILKILHVYFTYQLRRNYEH